MVNQPEKYSPEWVAQQKLAIRSQLEEIENQIGEQFELGKKEIEQNLINKVIVPISTAKLAELGLNLASNYLASKADELLKTEDNSSKFMQGVVPMLRALIPELLETLLEKLRERKHPKLEADQEE